MRKKSWLLLSIAVAMFAGGESRVCRGAPVVGAYYYPWYGPFPGGHGWNETLRGHLAPAQPPALGYYDSRSNAVIEAHIDQSHHGNISFWAVSWWGPSSAEDTTIRTRILTDPRADELEYAIHYESPGRLGTFDNPDFSNLVPDFQYLGQNYFNNPNYLRIDGRPVVFIYLTRAYFNTQAGRDAVANLRQTMASQFGVDPFLVGDDVFPGQLNAQRAALWDAITDFDVYGSALQAFGSTTMAVDSLASQFEDARQLANSVQAGFIPAISPGFNDRAVRDGHPAAPRYLTDVPGATEGSLFSALMDDAVLPNLDPAAKNILMVSTFNEWHEDTQIEPTILADPTTADDVRGAYTQGNSYSGYGNLYLDLLRAATFLAGDYNEDGEVNAADYVVWRMHAGTAFDLPNRNPLLAGNVGPADYQYWIDHFGAVAGTGSGSTFAVPEPACAVACSLGIFGLPHRLSRKAKTGISCGRERTDGPLHKTLIPLNRR